MAGTYSGNGFNFSGTTSQYPMPQLPTSFTPASYTAPTAAQQPGFGQQIQTPAGGYDNSAMVNNLAGGIASGNNAAANQSINSAANSMGGNTSSPAFAFLASMAKTGAAGQTGNSVANLKFNAANAGQQLQLQQEESNQSAANQAQQIANQFALGSSSQANQASQFNTTAGQNAQNQANNWAEWAVGNNNQQASQVANLNGTGASSQIANNLGYPNAFGNSANYMPSGLAW